MSYLMMNVEEIEELRDREKKLTEYLKKIEKWESVVIMTDECWNDGAFCLTDKLAKE